jgi:hypothetical protein
MISALVARPGAVGYSSALKGDRESGEDSAAFRQEDWLDLQLHQFSTSKWFSLQRQDSRYRVEAEVIPERVPVPLVKIVLESHLDVRTRSLREKIVRLISEHLFLPLAIIRRRRHALDRSSCSSSFVVSQSPVSVVWYHHS